MRESYTINFEDSIPMEERVAEVKRQLSVWLRSLEKPFEPNKDIPRLVKYEKNDHKHIYKYIIEREMKGLKKVII